jgi:hypothetical protein
MKVLCATDIRLYFPCRVRSHLLVYTTCMCQLYRAHHMLIDSLDGRSPCHMKQLRYTRGVVSIIDGNEISSYCYTMGKIA